MRFDNNEKFFRSFFVKGAKFVGEYDIPICPCTAEELPGRLIAYSDLHSNIFAKDAFVHFYLPDWDFDGKNGIWNNPERGLEKIRRCGGIITPDFSTYVDLALPTKIENTYRMRAFGYWIGKQGIPVINNVRWGYEDSFRYCLDGIPEESIIAVSTVGCIKTKIDRSRYSEGLDIVIARLRPRSVLVYGSTPENIFGKYMDEGIPILSYPSRRDLAFNGGAR